MKSLTGLWKAAADDAAVVCDTPIERDWKTVRSRVEDEGFSFLTITLPAFCSDFERSLELGRIESDLFVGFKKRKGLPAFLSGFLLQIFDGQSLELLHYPSPSAVRMVRQLTLLFKKIELDTTDARKKKALEGFLNCEVDLGEADTLLSPEFRKEFRRVSALLFGPVFDEINRKIDRFELTPAHGPGATADRKVGNQKFIQNEWTDRLEEYFPFGEYALPHWKYFKECEPRYLTPDQEYPVKITLVPKTLKTPRIIAIEPTAMQYAQQALMNEFVSLLESHPVTREFTKFTDQTVNQLAALDSSVNRQLATLDLSEASDRVLNSVVVDMLRPWPSLLGAVQACRSTTAELPGGEIISLRKFASMGSALTFPMEEMVFTTIIFMGLQEHSGRRITHQSDFVDFWSDLVHVYGDDIIVPTDSVNVVTRFLETFGLKVNTTKSFSKGNFRESCGGDYFMGMDVKPIRMKHVAPVTRQNVESVASWNAFMNSAFAAGFESAGQYARGVIEKAINHRLPDIPRDCGALGVETDPWLITADRQNPHTHTPEVRAMRIVPSKRANAIDGPWALRKTLTGNWTEPVFRDHLSHSGRSLASRIQRAWVPLS